MTKADLDYQFPIMHSEHRCWHEENQRWEDDAKNWQGEITDATRQLGRLESEIRAYSRSIADHVQAIQGSQRAMHEHEKAIRRYEAGELDVADGERMLMVHKDHAERHVQQREHHEALKKELHRFLAKLHALTAGI